MGKARCRACGTSSNIWARQCPNSAKTLRHLDGPAEDELPVCGVHARARYAARYRPDPTSKYQRPVEVWLD